MATHQDPISATVEAAKAELAQVDARSPSEALPHLRAAQEHVTLAIDEAMAAALVDEGGSLRRVGSLAGLSENAVGPRLARTSRLAAYESGEGRVTASGIERARYDEEAGRPAAAPAAAPLRFRRRRP